MAVAGCLCLLAVQVALPALRFLPGRCHNLDNKNRNFFLPPRKRGRGHVYCLLGLIDTRRYPSWAGIVFSSQNKPILPAWTYLRIGCPWLAMIHLWALLDPKQGSFGGKRRAHAQVTLHGRRTCWSQCCPLDPATGQSGSHVSPAPCPGGQTAARQGSEMLDCLCLWNSPGSGVMLVHGGEPQRQLRGMKHFS